MPTDTAITSSDDPILLAAKIAFKQYEAGEITEDKLHEVLRMCINAVAKTNGYAELFGLPFPETEP